MTWYGNLAAIESVPRLTKSTFVAYKLHMPMVKTRPFDAAEVLDSPEMIAAYLTEAFGSDDPL
jgi:hypothetical protein